jgi:hypothetical protein
VRRLNRSDQFEDVGTDEAIIKWSLKETEGYGQGLSGCCKNKNSIEGKEFLSCLAAVGSSRGT